MVANETGQRILIVDDEAAIRRFLHTVLSAQGYVPFEASSGQEAVSGASEHKPDVIVLDLGLPDMDGVQVTRLLREWTNVPILVLTVRSSEKDKIAALDVGADDYLTKPFGVGEFLARVHAVIRRASKAAADPVFVEGDLKIDLVHRLVTVAGREVQLTPTEYNLLRVLVVNAGKVITQRQLLKEVWGTDYNAEMHIVRVNISNLRHKIEPEPARPRYILTEPGVGYRLKTSS